MSFVLPTTMAPMEADTAKEIPRGANWAYEPKWDGFRCLVFRDAKHVEIVSKAGQPLLRYFPELGEALTGLHAERFVLEGEPHSEAGERDAGDVDCVRSAGR